MIDGDLVARFDDPPREYGPTPLWWWSGGKVTREGIRWQLERFSDGRIDNLVLINLAPKGPTYGAMPDDPAWFSAEWWELFSYTCEVAQELGIKLWFYDQLGFSGANIQGQITARHPEAAGRAIHSRQAVIDEDGTLEFLPREHVIGVYAERLSPSGPNPSEPEGWRMLDWEGADLRSAAGTTVRIVSWEETAFDYLDPAAVALLMDWVHGEYLRRVPEHVGTTIVGSFQDELPAMPTWSAGFLEAFERSTGYDLLPHLPSLWERGEGDDRIRFDFQRVRTHLAEDALFRPLGTWHSDRGMLIGADQTHPARAGLPTQGVQIYGDYFATHRWLNAVGSDHEGDARIHSSIADLYGHPRVWIEAFHSTGWGGTLEDTWDWLLPFFRSGANLYNPHASYYGLRAGWFEWAPPSTDFRQPYYAVYPQFSLAVSRVSAMLTWGTHVVDVGLLFPSTTSQAELPPDHPINHFGNGELEGDFEQLDAMQRTYMALAGKNDFFRSMPGLLDGIGIDFDVLDEDSIRGAVAADGALSMSGFDFRTLIVPAVDTVRAQTAERLVDFLDAAGQVIAVGHPPRHSAGRAGDDSAVERLATHPRLTVVDTPEEAVQLLAARRPYAWAEHGIRTQKSGDSAVAFVPGAYPNATTYPLRKVTDSTDWDDHDFDPARYASSTELRITAEVAEAEIWNPATGIRVSAPISFDGITTTITVATDGAPAVLVAWREGVTSQTAEVDTAEPVAEPFDQGWSQTLVPTLDNRWGDFALPASTGEIPLEIFRLQWRDGGEDAVPTRVSFGQRVVIAGPFEHAPVLSTEQAEAILAGGGLAGEGLVDEDWTMQTYSLSQGPDKDAGAAIDPKGFVKEEFITHPMPGAGQSVGMRTILRVDEPGHYELTIGASASKRVWVNGVELTGDDSGFTLTVPVTLASRVAVLEYRLGEPEIYADLLGHRPSTTDAYFTLDRPGSRVARPEFIAPGTSGVSDGHAVFSRHFALDDDAHSVTIVTGAATALTIELDGEIVARQEKVQYYDSGTNADPMYFSHVLGGGIPAGEHGLRVVSDSASPTAPLFVDILLETSRGCEVIVSDREWAVGPDSAPVELIPGRSGGTTHARAALRPHPLSAAHWLTGPPTIGESSVAFESAVSAVEQSQEFTVRVPPGTGRLELSGDAEEASMGGTELPIRGRTVLLDEPTRDSADITLVVAPRAFSVGGAVWEGPIVVATDTAPATFGDWSEHGLGAWSGGVRYERSIEIQRGERATLDLGLVRGAVQLSIDGHPTATAFCRPFSFDLGDIAPGRHELAVTLLGTLAPRYHSATPSTLTPPSQLRTGVFGPIRVLRSPARHDES